MESAKITIEVHIIEYMNFMLNMIVNMKIHNYTINFGNS